MNLDREKITFTSMSWAMMISLPVRMMASDSVVLKRILINYFVISCIGVSITRPSTGLTIASRRSRQKRSDAISISEFTRSTHTRASWAKSQGLTTGTLVELRTLTDPSLTEMDKIKTRKQLNIRGSLQFQKNRPSLKTAARRRVRMTILKKFHCNSSDWLRVCCKRNAKSAWRSRCHRVTTAQFAKDAWPAWTTTAHGSTTASASTTKNYSCSFCFTFAWAARTPSYSSVGSASPASTTTVQCSLNCRPFWLPQSLYSSASSSTFSSLSCFVIKSVAS